MLTIHHLTPIVITVFYTIISIKHFTNNTGYSSLRSRLDNKHLINTSRCGYISIDLPRFKDYVLLWHEAV